MKPEGHTETPVSERFTNQKRRIMSEKEFNSKWGGHGGKNYCHLCNHTFQIGEGWRWVYANGPKPEGVYSYGNFSVCDSCDGQDVLDRYQAACTLFHESMKERGEGHWPVDIAAKLIALQQANERMRRALDGLVTSAITCCPEYLALVANGKRDNETIQGWALGDWKKLNAALDIARAALAEAGGETGI